MRNGVVIAAVALSFVGAARAAELRVAVMEFGAAGATKGDLATLGKGLQSMITTDLAQVQAFKLVERARLSDLQSELKLSRSALIDKSTAVKLGKLAGATHLLGGTYTVVGDKMSIDCRLFSVQNGGVLLAEQIVGDKDAFFELEKQLVNKLVGSIGVKLAPKERADLARIHTADFEAFKQFSVGVDLFDAKKYDEAVAALRVASSRDQKFELAALTLSEYERIIGQLRSQASEMQTSQTELANLEKQKAAKGEVEVIKKLFAIANKKGDGQTAIDRLTALFSLAVLYGNNDSDPRDLMKLHAFEDRFALQRTADSLTQRYWIEAQRVFPKMPALVRGAQFSRLNQIPDAAGFDEWWKYIQNELTHYFTEKTAGCDNNDWTPAGRIRCNLQWTGMRDDPVWVFPRRLRLDARQEVELHEQIYQLAVKGNAPDEWKRAHLKLLAKEYRDVLDLARSTMLYTQCTRGASDPEELRDAADQIAENKKIAAALEKAQPALRAYMRERYLLRGELDDRTSIGGNQWEEMSRARAFPMMHTPENNGNAALRWNDGYLIVGGEAIWIVRPIDEYHRSLVSGPRSDKRRADEVRWFGDGAEPEHLTIIEGVPRPDPSLQFEAGFARPNDGNPDQNKRGRPEIGFVFGMRDVDVDTQPDPKSGKNVTVRPLRGFQLLIRPDSVKLIEMRDTDRKVVEEKSANLKSGDKLTIAVKLDGGAVKADVNGQSFSFKAPADRNGYYGLSFHGAGYVAVQKLRVNGKH